jgi:sn-glycerol 3-phosphate transport system substrate-binding protein
MPYYPDVKGAPQNSIIGGASLWVMGGKSKEEYKGVAKFLTYLSKPEVQVWWHEQTGYLPITNAAYELAKKQGYYDKNPAAEVSIKQMTLHPPTENSRGLRLGNLAQMRDVWMEEIEQVLAGKKTAQAGLDAAAARGNQMLRQFQRTVR